MDIAGTRERWRSAYQLRRDRAKGLVDRIPIFGRLISEFVRIEFIDRCMLIAAQGLLALVPTLVVLAAFFPHLVGEAVSTFSSASGVGGSGRSIIESEVDPLTVRTHTGYIGLAITIFSATSFARAIQRMYERIWERKHIGGVSGLRRCLLWLIGWLVTLQIFGAIKRIIGGLDGILGNGLEFTLQGLLMTLIWLVTSWALLFGRVPWHRLLLGAALTGFVGVVYNHGSSVVMPPYVRANADQFGTLGVILAVSTWLIGYAAIMVAAALLGRVISEDPTVHKVIGSWRPVVAWARRFGGPATPAPTPGPDRRAGRL
ncbi:YihY/virulence factor BrkB family protein [Nocardioides sp. GY 10113]|uniref:YhjD/YihY/BrkB family envelope integrity protein n=1 Tax=Nocardioides sp. GY 10113 TaxID=2569761 RepID=UPI0010A85F71|nr:YhjD/YihY/BrkB family envelope integrity protein [Nocardioides sp. GY 10113]TIC89139.1 YihY/virulence factor BrkB family protein [Nocardioides sp. GY 10113]